MMGSSLNLSRVLPIPGLGTPPEVSEAGACALYFDGTDLMLSENGGPWAPIASVPSAGGWTDDGAVVRLTAAADQCSIGANAPPGAEKLYVLGNGRLDGALGVNIDPTVIAATGFVSAILATADAATSLAVGAGIQKTGAGVIPQHTAFTTQVNIGAGTVTTYDAYVAQLAGAGAVINATGVKINDLGLAANSWGIQQLGAGDRNTFAGQSIFGGVAPVATELLRVVGDERIAGDLHFEDGAARFIDIDQRAAAESPGYDMEYSAGRGGNTAGAADGGAGGDTIISGAEGGDGDGANTSGAGGAAVIIGGSPGADGGAGVGFHGSVGIGLLNTSSIAVGNAVDNPATNFLGSGSVIFNSKAAIGPADGGAVWGALGRHASALLQLNSTTKGLATSRMTNAQRNGIAAPLESLLVYDTDASGTLDFYDGTRWREIAPYVDAGVVAAGGSYAAQLDDLVRCASALGSPITVTLPSASGWAMRAITVKEVAGIAGTINVATIGAETIDGAGSDSLSAAYAAATYISDGANWMKFT